jgi:hypothetical protein
MTGQPFLNDPTLLPHFCAKTIAASTGFDLFWREKEEEALMSKNNL